MPTEAASMRPWEEDPAFELFSIPANGPINPNPAWRDRGYFIVVLGWHLESPVNDLIVSVAYTDELGVTVFHLREYFAQFGYRVTGVAYRSADEAVGEKQGGDYPHLNEIRRLRRRHRPEVLITYSQHLRLWDRNRRYNLCSIGEFERQIPVRNSGEFLLLGPADHGFEPVIISDACRGMLEQIRKYIDSARGAGHRLQSVAFRFLVGESEQHILDRRKAIKTEYPPLMKFE
jgi:hypothetical protein